MSNVKKTIPTLVGGAILLGNVSVLATEDIANSNEQNQELEESEIIEVDGGLDVVENEIVVEIPIEETMENIEDYPLGVSVAKVVSEPAMEIPQEQIYNIANPNARAVSEQKVMIVNKDAIVVRETSSVSSLQVGVLKQGAYVDVYEQNTNEGWSKINFQGKMAYVNTVDLVDVKEVKKESTENNVSVRSGAGDSYGEFGKLAKYEQVQVYQELTNGWSKINYKGKIAFIETSKLQNTYISKSTVVVEKVSVYSAPLNTSSILGESKKNETLFIYAEEGTYYKVRFGEGFGFVNKDDLKLIQNIEKPQTGDAMVFSYVNAMGMSVLGLVAVNRKKEDR